MFEVEFKFKVKDKEKFEKELEKRNCEFLRLHQCDSIYVKEGINDFNLPAGENVLRIRRENDVSYITLKQRLNHLEYETTVGDVDVIHNIFVALGYHKLVEVDKYRSETKLNDFNITIDEVDKLGCFVEIEKLTKNEAEIESIKKEILDFAGSIGFSEDDIETRKYDTMMLEVDNN